MAGRGSGNGCRERYVQEKHRPCTESMGQLALGQDMPTGLAVPGALWDRASLAKDP